MPNSIKITKSQLITRRGFLSLSGKIGVAATLPLFAGKNANATSSNEKGIQQYKKRAGNNASWIAEARIGELSLLGGFDKNGLNTELSLLVKQGVSIVKVDSGFSHSLSKSELSKEIQRVKEVTKIIQSHGLKVMWYTPAFKVITKNGVYQLDSFARTHADWLQVSFDGKDRGVSYGEKGFQAEENDEVAWLCPCSPYRQWVKKKLQILAKTGVDGIWLDVFGQMGVEFPCSCHYCQKKFTTQTGFAFHTQYDATDQSFWKYVSWRHKIITRFLSECKAVVRKASPNTVVIAEMGALDHTDPTYLGAEAIGLKETLVVWNVTAISEQTGMAGASYDEWIALHNIYKCCQGTTRDNLSWVYCYGHQEADAQLVVASAIAAQNNPYALSLPSTSSSVGLDFREAYFHWIQSYSKQIFQSVSVAPVAVLYSERNRDFLDINARDNMPVSSDAPEYLEDYRGLSTFLYQHQIPTDVYPFSRVDDALLARYSVLVLPFMASISKDEKLMLLSAVRNGATLILTGTEQGLWDDRMTRRDNSLWDGILGGAEDKEVIVRYGRGRLFFWKEAVGQRYLETRDSELRNKLIGMIHQAGVGRWLTTKQPVVVQPYRYQQQMVIHLLNYSWVGEINNQSNRISIELSIPWELKDKPVKITQTEPGWSEEKVLSFKKVNDKVVISVEIGINALVLIDLA
jgi:hypothetical protein